MPPITLSTKQKQKLCVLWLLLTSPSLDVDLDDPTIQKQLTTLLGDIPGALSVFNAYRADADNIANVSDATGYFKDMLTQPPAPGLPNPWGGAGGCKIDSATVLNMFP